MLCYRTAIKISVTTTTLFCSRKLSRVFHSDRKHVGIFSAAQKLLFIWTWEQSSYKCSQVTVNDDVWRHISHVAQRLLMSRVHDKMTSYGVNMTSKKSPTHFPWILSCALKYKWSNINIILSCNQILLLFYRLFIFTSMFTS